MGAGSSDQVARAVNDQRRGRLLTAALRATRDANLNELLRKAA